MELIDMRHHLFKEALCSSMEELDCVNMIKVDTSMCLKPCSGLIATASIEESFNFDELLPYFLSYKRYKERMKEMSNQQGNLLYENTYNINY